MKMLLILPLLLLPGCASLLINGGTEGAIIVAQERTPSDAVGDAAILISIKNLYAQQDFEGLLLNIDVKVIEGRVLLAGNVEKIESQIDAVRLAWEVDGVKEVMSEVQVNNQSDILNYAQDVSITTQIRARLLLEKDLRSVNFSTITVNQVAYMMGIAQDEQELKRATTVASTTVGVKRVVSYIQLKNDPRRKHMS